MLLSVTVLTKFGDEFSIYVIAFGFSPFLAFLRFISTQKSKLSIFTRIASREKRLKIVHSSYLFKLFYH